MYIFRYIIQGLSDVIPLHLLKVFDERELEVSSVSLLYIVHLLHTYYIINVHTVFIMVILEHTFQEIFYCVI